MGPGTQGQSGGLLGEGLSQVSPGLGHRRVGAPGSLRTLPVLMVGGCQRLRLVCKFGYAPVGVTPRVCFGGFLKSHCLPTSPQDLITLMWLSVSEAARGHCSGGAERVSWVQTGLPGAD